MPTANDIIVQSLKAMGVLGIGQTPNAEDINDGLTSLRQMIAQWQMRRWMVPSLQEIVAIGNGQVSNPVGPGQYFDIAVRPDKIQYAFARQFANSPNAVDYPLRMIASYENYATISLKRLNSFPDCYFYDNAQPISNIFIWPIPNGQYEIHLLAKSPFTVPDNVSDTLVFPAEYEEALWSNLAIRMCTTYQTSATPELIALAKVALETVRISNAQISELIVPGYYGRNGRYNIYSDSFGW